MLITFVKNPASEPHSHDHPNVKCAIVPVQLAYMNKILLKAHQIAQFKFQARQTHIKERFHCGNKNSILCNYNIKHGNCRWAEIEQLAVHSN